MVYIGKLKTIEVYHTDRKQFKIPCYADDAILMTQNKDNLQ